MANLAVQNFINNGTVTIPGGVTYAIVTAEKRPISFGNDSGQNSFMIDVEDRLWGWGRNGDGQLGIGSVSARSSPVQVLGGFRVKRVVSAENDTLGGSACLLTLDGVPYCWGRNDFGQLGDGTVVSKSSPVAVLGGLIFTDVQGRDATFIGMTAQGALYGWGKNPNGVLGVGDTTPRSSPVAVLGGFLFSKFQLSFAASGTLTVFAKEKTTGLWYGWGYNASGGLGVGDTIPRSSPVAVLGGLAFDKIYNNSPQWTHGLINGVAYGWGFNSSGILGVGDNTNRSSPVAVLGGLFFRELVNGSTSMFGLTYNNLTGAPSITYAWGFNTNGQLGVGNTTARSSPVAVLGSLILRQAVSCWDFNEPNTIGIDYNGAAWGWGKNTFGGVGDGTQTPRSSPVAVLGGLTFVMLHRTGDLAGHTFATADDGFTYGWGAGSTLSYYGAQGNGGGSKSSPVAVIGSLQFNIVGYQRVNFVPVTPGQSYGVKLLAYGALFGYHGVADRPVDTVRVAYFQ